MDRLTIARPDDWHLHLRDGAAMASVLADTARRFARAIVMPNLQPPVTTTQQALHYRDRILAVLRLADHFDTGHIIELFPHHLSGHRLVIDKQSLEGRRGHFGHHAGSAATLSLGAKKLTRVPAVLLSIDSFASEP